MIKTNSFKINRLGWAFLAALVGLVPLLTAAAAGPAFYDPGFANTWNRADKPLLDLPGGAGRGYTWGPAFEPAAKVTQEPYNGGTRTVQYFDKARMEVNNPKGNPQDLYYVTTGLLVKELVTGKRQDGDNSFTQQKPSEVQVAGDSNEGGQNAVAPTYASFNSLGTFRSTENGQPNQNGKVVNQNVTRNGTVSTINPPEQRLIKGYDDVTKHNIPDVFVDFGNDEGPIWNGSIIVNGQVLFGNPTYVMGRPITEAYWTRVVVRGVEQDVMVQLFERRVLTYTPANGVGFKVEMGNVGQHYYRWRYTSTPAQPALVPFFNVGKDLRGMQEPLQVAVDSKANTFVLTRNVNGIQKYDSTGKFVTSWGSTGDFNERLLVDSKGNIYRAGENTGKVLKYDNNGNALPAVGSAGTNPGQFEKVIAMGLDRQDNLYVLDSSSTDYEKKILQKFDSTGKLLSRIDLRTAVPNFDGYLGNYIAVDSQGNIYIQGAYLYSKNYNKGIIYKFDNQGKYLTKLDDPNINARNVVIDSKDNLFINNINSTPNTNQVLKLDTSFKTLASWGQAGELDAQFRSISGMAVDMDGNVSVSDFEFNRIQKFNNNGNYLGKFGSYALQAGQLRHPEGVAVDDSGLIYVADTGNARVQIFDGTGKFVREFGSRGTANGQFQSPTSIVVDTDGNIYVADPTNQKVQKFDSTGKFLQNWGAPGTLTTPFRLGIDGLDNIYVFETGTEPLKKFNKQGQFLRTIGLSGSGNDQVYYITSFVVERIPGKTGKIYLLDDHSFNGNYQVVRIYDSEGAPQGTLGNPLTTSGLDVVGPQSLAFDKNGNFYISDTKGNLKKFNPKAELVATWEPGTYAPDNQPDLRNMVGDHLGFLLAVDLGGDKLLKLDPGNNIK